MLIYLWPVLVGGRIFTAAGTLYTSPPFISVAPRGVDFNQLLSDIPTAFYPWDSFDRNAIHHGIIPTWNNLVLGGTPYFTNPQAGFFSLFNLPLWIFSLSYGLGVVAALKLWIGALGTYFLVRELGLRFWPGMLAGVSFGFCSFDILWLAHQAQTAVSVLLPWLVLFVERILRSRSRWDVLGLAAMAALAINGGHPGTETHVLGAAVVYGLVRAMTLTGTAGRERGQRLGRAYAGMALGTLLMAVFLIPVIKAGAGTSGQALRAGGGPTLPTSTLKTALFPDWWGRPSGSDAGGPSNFVERTMYAGTVALLLAGLGLTLTRDWRRKLPFAVIGALGLAVSFGLPVIHTLVVHVPLFDSVNDQRMVLLFEFAVSVLAAFGLQALGDATPSVKLSGSGVIGAGVIAAVIALVAADPSQTAISHTWQHFRPFGNRTSLTPVDALPTTSIAWWLIFTVGTGLALYLTYRRGRRLSGRNLQVALVVLAAVDMYHFAHGFQTMASSSWAIPPRTPAVAYLQAHSGEGRVAGLNYSLQVDWTMNYGLRDVRGHDAPQPSLRYFHIWQVINPQQDGNELAMTQLTPAALQALSTLGMRYLVTPVGQTPPEAALTPVYRGRDATILRNSAGAPDTFVPSHVQRVSEEAASLRTITSPGFDPRRDAVVETSKQRPVQATAGLGNVQILTDHDDKVEMSAELTRAGLVVLNDAWAAGWSAEVDGRPATVLRVNDVMRGLDVPRGRHRISWHYRVPGLRLGAVISIAALILTIGWATVIRGRRRRPLTR